jgi:hypothetical protein
MRSWEEAGVRVIGRPHDLVRADIVGQDGEASFDRLERPCHLGRRQDMSVSTAKPILIRIEPQSELRAARPDRHRGDAGPRDRRPSLLGRFFGRQLGIPVDSEKASTSHLPACV